MDNSRLDQDDDAFLDDEEEAARLLEMSFDFMHVGAIQTQVEAAAVPVAVAIPAGKVACKHCRKPLTRQYMSKHLTKCKSRPQTHYLCFFFNIFATKTLFF